MKKLMFTLIVVALSGSSLFGTKRVMNQNISDCMERKRASSMDMTNPKAQRAYDQCFKELYPDGYYSKELYPDGYYSK